MFYSDRPHDAHRRHRPTPRGTAEEWGGRIATVRETPPAWFFLVGRQSTNGYLCHIDLNYHRGREFLAIVQTSRPLPPEHRIGSVTTPQSQLANFLANSDRFDYDPRTGQLPAVERTSTDVLRLDGTPVPVEIHHGLGCRSALIPALPDQSGYVIVTAPDEHWEAVTELVLRPPTTF
ncbi:hypothetical protein AB0F71_34845 [Kitasatospora sp. NPDC028055]|uniref:hypothetical protein n=1 Tax=Kitasatospora sp. NPDC028055 TaxID=3155653 RepID=UPI0033F9D016